MNKYFFLLLFVLLTFKSAHSQRRGYFPGYIVTIKGDTVEGFVKDRSAPPFTDIYTKVRFKADSRTFRKKYNANQILGYGSGGTVFESVPLREELQLFKLRYHVNNFDRRVFLRLIKRNHKLTLYHREYMDDESDFIDFYPLLYINRSNEMVRATQGVLGLKRKRLAEYFRGCPDLVDAIENKDLRWTDEVFEYYTNRCN